MNVSAHPSVLFALGAGLLTALTPVRLPDDSDHPRDLRRQGGHAAGARAGARVRLRRRHRRDVRRARHDLRAHRQQGFGAYLATRGWSCRWRCSSWRWACRCSAPSRSRCRRACSSACRASAAAGFGGAFLMGLVGGIIAAPCTGPPLLALLAYVATTRDAAWGFVTARDLRRGRRRAASGCWRRSRCRCPGPAPGWTGSRASSASCFSLAALYYLKNVVPALAHFTSPSPRFALAMAAMIVGRPRAGRDSQDVLRRRAREGAQGAGRRPGDGRVCSARSTTCSRRRARSSSPG